MADELGYELPNRWLALILLVPAAFALFDGVRIALRRGRPDIQSLARGIVGILFAAIGVLLAFKINTGFLLPILIMALGAALWSVPFLPGPDSASRRPTSRPQGTPRMTAPTTQPTSVGEPALAPAPSHGGPEAGLWTPSVLVPVGALAAGILLQVLPLDALHLPLIGEIALAVAILGLVFTTVFVALRHAEAVAHIVGEPFGTLVLTISVTAIEASVIVSVMLVGEPNPAIARESVFSTVMIVCAECSASA
ncbi:MAG: hypothetical protein WDN31_11605 [Hyphomicrobium sp.]